MKKIALLAVGACALWSNMAMGADMAVKYVPRPCCEGWAGFYFGVYFGSGLGRASETFTRNQSETNSTIIGGVTNTGVTNSADSGPGSGDITGSVVDLFVGYNWQPDPSIVVGAQFEGTVFSDVSLKTIGTSTNNSTSFFNGVLTGTSSFSGTFERTDQLRSMFALVGRAGWLATPNILIYGLGGVTLGNFVFPDSDDLFGGKNSKWQVGYTVGAGGEARLNKNWSLRAEYRFVHFNVNRNEADSSSSITTGVITTTSSSTDSAERTTKFDFHLGKIGVAYRFCYCD